MDFQFNEVHARYFRFSVGDELTTNYTLMVGGYDPSSDAGKNTIISCKNPSPKVMQNNGVSVLLYFVNNLDDSEGNSAR